MIARRLLPSLLLHVGLALAVLCGLLVAAQAVRLWPAGVVPRPALLLPAVLALAEPALPLAALFGAGLTYGRLRRQGALVALAALGTPPARVLAPAVAVGVMLGGLAAFVAADAGPRAVTDLRARALDLEGPAPAGLLRLPAGAALEIGGPPEARTLWAGFPSAAGPVLVHGQRPALLGGGAGLTLGPTWIWGPRLRAQVGEVVVRLGPDALHRRLQTLGAPHDLPTAALDPTDRRHAFLAARRLALPALAPIWALLGGLLGGGLGGRRAVVAGAAAVGAALWLLRTGELTARAGFLAPALAAWAPVALVALLAAWAWIRLAPGHGTT
ncbi:MAG: LptF/LptG family permease [bacterium]